MALTLGIDVACRAAHQATLAADGKTVWRGRKFWTRPADLERLWNDLDLEDPGELTVVVEPTRNAWIVVAEWFRRRGAKVVMVPTTQSSDLRKYYSKHTKNDRIDSELLARLPLLHPEGLREYSGQGPADPLRRLTKQRSTMVKRRTAVFARLDALTELLGPAWYEAMNARYGIAALEFLARYADPHAVIRLGQARLTRFLIGRSRGERDSRTVGRRGWRRNGLRRTGRRHRPRGRAGAVFDRSDQRDRRTAREPLRRRGPRRHRRLSARSRSHDQRGDRRPDRRPPPVHVLGRGPCLLRPGA